MHDASEAYLQDMPTPIKMLMPEYKAAEKVLEAAVQKHFGLVMDERAQLAVRTADLQMLAVEARDLMGDPQDWESLKGIVMPESIKKVVSWSPERAEAAFLERYRYLKMENG